MVPNNSASPTASVLLGGHVWELNSRSLSISERDPILTLFYHSATPTTYSQSENILNPYFPSSNKRKVVNQLHVYSNSALETAATSSRTIQSYGGALTAFFKALILGKPIQLTGPLVKSSTSHMSNYFISNNFGCFPNGFSTSTSSSPKGHKTLKSTVGQSPRLPSALLHPPTVPLSELAIQHLLLNLKRKGVFALNSGGLHYFDQVQPIEKLQSLLLASKASSMGRDECLKDFFKIYGYSEGCSMALSIAVSEGSSDILIERAVQTALSFAFRPSMIRLNQSYMNSSNASMRHVGIADTVPGYDDYAFKSSFLYDGLLSLVSRLLRPIWCKPAIVVTESKIIPPRKKGGRQTYVPAKVELLLDETRLEQIRRPLANLQHLMRETFAPAILSVPGTNIDDVDMVDISETSDVMTRAVTYQNQLVNQSNVKDNLPKEKDLRNAARSHEDRNMHALYRLVSRAVQVLQLVSYLHSAHLTPELPEVEFGLLHGLTYSQLVTLKASQERIESVLTDIFSRDATMTTFGRDNIGSTTVSTVESENLSALLYRNCYLYFSIGSRLSFLGFKNAYAAMSQPSISRRNELVSNASTYFRQASKHWCNLVHVTGGLSEKIAQSSKPSTHLNTFQHFNDIAKNAIENGSPLARAAIVLLELNDVVGIVDICLECSKNFDSNTVSKFRIKDITEEQVVPMLSWEKSLYHRHLSVETEGQISNSTHNQDSDLIAKHTCYALLCYHINKLLESAAQLSQNKQLVERMLSVVISSQNMDFIFWMFDYLSASNHVETFLSIDSPALEKWLKEHDSDTSLLWRYYTIHNIHWMAGEVAWNRGACDETLLLSDRLEFLTRALNSYTIAQRELGANSTLLQRGSNIIASVGSTESISQIYASVSPSREDLSRSISQVSEQIDIAKLQSRILSEILQSQNADKINQDQLSFLETKLVNVSDLYNIFACPLAMYDVCLAIIQTCKYDDEATVLKLWKSIICEEIIPCRTENAQILSFLSQFKEASMLEEEEVILSATAVRTVTGEILKCFDDGDWKNGLIARVTGLGRELLREGSYFVFPIQHISDWLESINRVYCGIAGNEHDRWVLKTLIDSGASFSSVLQAYDSNFSSLDDSSLRLSQLLNLAEILEMWLDKSLHSRPSGDNTSTSSDALDLRRYKTAILNQIDEYKAFLESLVTTITNDTTNVSERFNQIEKELRKLL
jgi:nuclear pore complex protein Nup155